MGKLEVALVLVLVEALQARAAYTRGGKRRAVDSLGLDGEQRRRALVRIRGGIG